MIRQTDIFLNGRKCTLGEGQVVALTRQINDIGDIKSRQSNLTNTFRIGYFGENEKNLNFAGRPGSMSRYPYRNLPARVVQNGFEVIRNGNAVIQSTGEHSASVTIYWGNNDFFDRLNFPLSELDLSGLDHRFSVGTIFRLGALRNWDVFYPFCEYGNSSIYHSNHLAAENFSLICMDILKAYPAVKCSYLLRRISERIGFNFVGSVFDNPDFQTLSIQLQQKTGIFPNKEQYFVKSEDNRFGGDWDIAGWRYLLYNHMTVIKDNHPDSFPQYVSTHWQAIQENTGYVNRTGRRGLFKFRIILNHVFKNNMAAVEGFGQESIYRVWVTKGEGGHPITSFTETDSFSTPRQYEFEVLLNPLEFIQIFCITVAGNELSNQPGSTFETLDISLPDLKINDFVGIAESMPELTALDFIKTIAQMYGLIFETTGKEVQWITFRDILKTKGQNAPWTAKIIKDSIRTEYNPGSYYQRNNVMYESGANPEKKTSLFELENKALDKQGDLIELEAYLPDIIEKPDVGMVMHIMIYDQRQSKQTIDIPFFLFQERLQPQVPGQQGLRIRYAYSEGNINENPAPMFWFGESYPAGVIEGITPEAIIQNNYSVLINILKNFKRFTIECFLSEPEFFALSHYNAYYVPELLTFVYVEKISNYVSGKPCQITLIAI